MNKLWKIIHYYILGIAVCCDCNDRFQWRKQRQHSEFKISICSFCYAMEVADDTMFQDTDPEEEITFWEEFEESGGY